MQGRKIVENRENGAGIRIKIEGFHDILPFSPPISPFFSENHFRVAKEWERGRILEISGNLARNEESGYNKKISSVIIHSLPNLSS